MARRQSNTATSPGRMDMGHAGRTGQTGRCDSKMIMKPSGSHPQGMFTMADNVDYQVTGPHKGKGRARILGRQR